MVIELAERLLIAFGDTSEQGWVDHRCSESWGVIHTRASYEEQLASSHVRHDYSILRTERAKGCVFVGNYPGI